jgi:hypothetical protein
MPGHVRVSGSWRELNGIHVRVGGVWRAVTNGYVRVGGVWREFFSLVALGAGPGGTITRVDLVAPYNTSVGIRFNADGTIETLRVLNGILTPTAAGNWIDPVSEITGTEEVRFTNFNGAGGGDWTGEAAADDTWTGITTTQTWLMNSSSLEDISFTCDFEVRDTGLDTASASYTFRVLNDSF